MKFKVRLIQSDEGFAVSCPSFPGCHSQGKTEQEAIENITDCRTIQKSALLKNI